MHIYCSAGDRYPPRFVDITELMFRQLVRHGIHQTWYMQATGESGETRIDDRFDGVLIITSPFYRKWGLAGKLLSKVVYWSVDTLLLLLQLRRPLDAVMVRDKYWASIPAWALARIKRVPYLVWMSYPYPEHDLERAGTVGFPLNLLLRISGHAGRLTFYRFAMRRADHCFVQSEKMKSVMHERNGIALERMTAVPMGVGDRFLHPEQIEPIADDLEVPTVLYLGGLESVRRLELMIDAFALIAQKRPDVQFRVVGSGSSPDDQPRLEAHARQLGIRDRILFTGQLPFAHAMQYVMAADVCLSPIPVTPTLEVASPTKFVEYLALGRPTVGNDHPEQTMIAERSQGALTVPWSAEGFAQACLWCLDHPEEALAMARRGQEWVRQNRSYDHLGAEVARRFLELVSRHTESR